MKKINKIASFISGMALCFQPLVGAMSSHRGGTVRIEDPNGKVSDIKMNEEEYQEFLDAQSFLDDVLKLSKTALKFKIYNLAKDIKKKNLPNDNMNKIIEDLLNFECEDELKTPISEFAKSTISFDEFEAKKIRSNIDKILQCAGNKKNTALNTIVDRNDIEYVRELYLAFNAISTSVDYAHFLKYGF